MGDGCKQKYWFYEFFLFFRRFLIAFSNRLNAENEHFANILLCILVFVPLLFIIYPLPKIVFDGIRQRILHCFEERRLQQIKQKEMMQLEMERRRQRKENEPNAMSEVE